MSPYSYVAYGIATVAMVISTVTDIRSGKIKNVITVPAMILGIALTVLAGGWYSLFWPVVAAISLFVFGVTGFVGNGDIKLMMACTLLCGPINMLITFGGGAVISILYWLWKDYQGTRRAVRDGLFSFVTMRPGNAKGGRKIAMAPFLTVAFLIVSVLQLTGIVPSV